MMNDELYVYTLEQDTLKNITKDFPVTYSPANAANQCVAKIGQKKASFCDEYNIVYEQGDDGEFHPICMYFIVPCDDWYDINGYLGQWLDEDDLDGNQIHMMHALMKRIQCHLG